MVDVRILIVVSEVPPVTSGLAKSVGEIIDGLRGRGHKVFTLSANDASGLRWDRLRVSAAGLRLKETVAAQGPFDVVNVHGPSPTISDLALVQMLARPSLRLPVVYTHHFSIHFAVPIADTAAAVYEAVIRRLVRRCDAIVVTTPSYRSIMGRRGTTDCHVIPWGVDHQRFSPGDDLYDGVRPLRVLVVGQFRRYKGMAVALEAIAGVPQLQLTLAGAGPLVGHICGRITEMGATNVAYAGAVDDDQLGELLTHHDVILLPSRTRAEAFGIILLEGMASGCVPIASDLPGVRDVVGHIGLTSRPGDAAALRAVLISLAADPEAVRLRRELAIKAADSYRWEGTVSAYERLLCEVAARRSRGS